MTDHIAGIESPSAPLPRLPVGRTVCKPAPDFRASATAWLTAGAAHRTVMSAALVTETFEDYARMPGTGTLVMDSTTTLRSFEAEIRANAACYRLARGISVARRSPGDRFFVDFFADQAEAYGGCGTTTRSG